MDYKLAWAATGLLCFLAAPGFAQGEAGKRLTNVEVLELSAQPISASSSYMGHLEPAQRVTISSEVAGALEALDLEEGQAVKAGQVLGKIDTSRLSLNYKLARSSYELAKDEYDREKKLFAKQLSNQAKLSQIKNKMELAFFQMRLAQVDLEKSQLVAPFAGVVSKKMTHAGEYLNKGAPILELIDLSSVKARIQVPEREISFVARGKAVSVTLDSFPDREFKGSVSALSMEADQKSRSFRVEVVVENGKGELFSGMLARVRMVTQNLTDQLVLPRDAILEDEKGSYVFVLAGDQALKRPVALGLSLGDQVQVTKGLSFGEKVVVVGQQMVTHQERVSVLKSSKQPL